MPDTVEVISAYGAYYYIDSSHASDVLTTLQMESNVTVMHNIVSDKFPSWTTEALAALCGNGQSEGALNPSQWQYGLNKSLSGGYGLWQWTPATKFLNWAADRGYDRTSILYQIYRIEFERSTGIQYYATTDYNFSFTDFLTGVHTVEELARAWLYNYERPADPASSESIRVQRSERWYTFLTGQEPTPPGPEPPGPGPKPQEGGNGMPLYMYPAFRKK